MSPRKSSPRQQPPSESGPDDMTMVAGDAETAAARLRERRAACSHFSLIEATFTPRAAIGGSNKTLRLCQDCGTCDTRVFNQFAVLSGEAVVVDTAVYRRTAQELTEKLQANDIKCGEL